jgi:hypothetical protein
MPYPENLMPNPTSLKNLRPWRPGQSGNPRGRPRAPKFTEREQHEIVVALAGVLDEPTRRAATEKFQAALTSSRTVLKALEPLARVNGELNG